MPEGYVPKGYRVKPLSRDKIRSSAHTVLDVLRERMELQTAKLPIVEVVEWLDVHEVLDLEILESGWLGGSAAELRPVPGHIPLLAIDEEIYEKACSEDHFSRFTLAHELGHYFLHSSQPVPMARATLPNAHRAFEDTEWQANAFAGELLVDSRLVRRFCSSPLEIVTTFGVSVDVARIQWLELKKRGIV